MCIETNQTEIQETVGMIRTHPTAPCCGPTKAKAQRRRVCKWNRIFHRALHYNSSSPGGKDSGVALWGTFNSLLSC